MANSCNSIPKFMSSNKHYFPHARDLIRILKLPIHSKLHFRAYASSRQSKWKRDRDGEEEYEDFEMKERRRERYRRRVMYERKRDREEAYEDYEMKERRRERERYRRSVMNERKTERNGRSLITISPAGKVWDSKWDCNYVLTLSELELEYLAVDGEEEAEVHVFLTVQQHTGFGLSIHGRVATSFNKLCGWCWKPFFKEINTTFDVTVLPEPSGSEFGLPDLRGDDSVIYIKYGSEAELDSFIHDTIEVEALSQDICSKTCGDTPMILFSEQNNDDDPSPRWPQLLRFKQALLEKERQSSLEKGSDSNSE